MDKTFKVGLPVKKIAENVGEKAGMAVQKSTEVIDKTKEAVFQAVDVNGDGQIDIEDVILLAFKVPGVSVNRENFLRKELFTKYSQETIDQVVLTTPMKAEIKQEDIMIATPKKEKEAPTIMRGRIEFFNTSKGFGFIKDLSGTEKYFFHINNVTGDISENDIVTFDLERGMKGMNAVNVRLEETPEI